MTFLLPCQVVSTKDSTLGLKIASNDTDTGRQYTSSKKGGVSLKVTSKQCTLIRSDDECNSTCWNCLMMLKGGSRRSSSSSSGFLNEFPVWALLAPQRSVALFSLSFCSWNSPLNKSRVRLRSLLQLSFGLHGLWVIYRVNKLFVWSCSPISVWEMFSGSWWYTRAGICYYIQINASICVTVPLKRVLRCVSV